MHSGWWAFLQYDDSRPKALLDRRTLKRVLVWARPYRAHFGGLLALLLVISLLELIPPLLYGALINGLVDGSLDVGGLNRLAIGLLGVPIATSLLSVAQRRLGAGIGEGVIHDLRVAMYDHVQRMGLRYFTATKTGDILSRFTNDVVGAQGAVTNTIPNLLANLLTLTTTLAVMLRLDWRLTLVAVGALPLFLIPTRRVGVVLRDIRREMATHDANMTSRIQETLNVSGAILVKTFGRNKDEAERFATSAAAVRDIGIRRAVVGRWFFFGLGVAGAIGTALMYWLGGYFAIAERLSPGTIVTFAAYVGRLYGPISGLSNIQVELATSLVSFERVFEVLDQEVEIREQPAALHLASVAGRVTFDNVSFRYESGPAASARGADTGSGSDRTPSQARDWALAGVSFDIAPGQLAALVGPSGAGKTTVGYLVARLYDPTEGRVSLDGHDLRDISLESLAQHVGVVTQETYLFHDTILANLRFARPSATDEEVHAACRAANIHGFVSGLAEGYATVVGERGYRLSGGEKQRLALARVILKDPSVLVLDEATSHLDSQSENLVQAALAAVMHGRTSLVIAHRLATVLAADIILVLDRGVVVEQGSHAELLAAGGLYAELYQRQFRQLPDSQDQLSA